MTALAVLLATTFAAAAQPPAPIAPRQSSGSQLFAFETDEFWLNLHHFLYVVGRTQAGIPEGGRRSDQDSVADAERGLQRLTADERKSWADSVRAYAAGLSLRGTLERPMSSTTRALAEVDDAPTLSGVALDAALIATLERVAPIYRRTWWPAHLAGNRAWRSSAQALVDRHGAAVVDYVTKSYEIPWPAAGFAIHVSAYANYGSAYSSGFDNIIVVPSLSNQTAGLYALEAIVHEALHQWDGQTFDALAAEARAVSATVPRDLPHALIFYTSGEAVRNVEPAHVPMVDALDIWSLKLSGAALPARRLKPLLEELWKPHLEGSGTRDEVFRVLVPRAAAVSQP